MTEALSWLLMGLPLIAHQAIMAGNQEPEGTTGADIVVFQRAFEPRERAFNLLVPRGWITEGGIFRVDPLTQGGPSQSIAAKLDFAVKRDQIGSVMIRWLPDVLYFDARMSPAGQMGLYPPGSNYQGMTVYPVMSASQFMKQIAFPYAHPAAADVRVIEERPLQQMAQNYYQREIALAPFKQGFSYDVVVLTFSYREGGSDYKEKMVCVIENWGALGAGMWGNRETFLLRAPLSDFERWEAIFSIIQSSMIVNSQWLTGEIQGQIQRGQIAIETQRQVQQIEQQIVEHRQKTNAEIHNDMFLTLTDQQEYVNPYTSKIEIGSNQWQYRWVNESNDVIYTNDQNYDPNHDINLNRSDFKRTPIRKRFPNDK